tara:strand:+ start:709 stop:1692 length:984 start_codon:yes stop_codon:yes gene_type:complete
MAENSAWLMSGLEDDVRPRMFEVADRGEAFALATIVKADGGPRPVGAQMVVTARESWGFLSGGCIEDDVALNAREVIDDGQPRAIVYGTGSPLIDIRLPCGGSIEVIIERVSPTDAALADLRSLTSARRPAVWISDGRLRKCIAQEHGDDTAPALIVRHYFPCQRLVVVGSDPFALAIAGLGQTVGWDVSILAPFGPQAHPPIGVSYDRRTLAEAMNDPAPDRWTAVAVATHDLEQDESALIPALQSPAGYVGVLGSRRKLDQRLAGLRSAGLDQLAIARLSAPIGLNIGASSPWEVALSVVAEIVDACRGDTRGVVAPLRKPHVAA